MKCRPKVIAFDVIETLFPLQPLSQRFKSAALALNAIPIWFGRTLRDGMTLTATGQFKGFHEVAAAALEGWMAERGIEADEAQVEQMISGLSDLPPHDDVRPALQLVRSAGLRTVLLTNGSERNTRHLVEEPGLADLVDQIVSIDEVRQWKPFRAVYLHAAQAAGVEPNQLALVAAHAWDIHGAAHAGLTTAWFPRQEKRFPQTLHNPDIKAGSLLEAVQKLLELPMR